MSLELAWKSFFEKKREKLMLSVFCPSLTVKEAKITEVLSILITIINVSLFRDTK